MYDYIRRYIRTGVKPLHREDSIREASRRLSVEQPTDLPVVDSPETMVGLLARGFEDIAEEARKVMDEPIDAFMRHECASQPPDFSVPHACELFLHRRQGAIPIVEGGKPVGLIRRSDIGRAIIEGAARLSPQQAGQPG